LPRSEIGEFTENYTLTGGGKVQKKPQTRQTVPIE
jgi:hypothetical protein